MNYDSCLTGNAVCTNGVCACDTGFVRQGSVCTPIVNGEFMMSSYVARIPVFGFFDKI